MNPYRADYTRIDAIISGMMARPAAHCILFGWWLAALLAGCAARPPAPSPTQIESFTPSAAATHTSAPQPSRTASLTPTFDPLRPWGSFAAPAQTPITPIPPPVAALALPNEVRALVVLGSDSRAPFVSRTDAIQVFLYHPRLSRASLVSLPPDLMVYIPGFTMQRLQVAYAVGGWRGLADTLQYNFGIRPSAYVLVHLDEFVRFIDQNLGGLDVPVLQDYRDFKYCGGIPPGIYHMTGEQVLCYVRFRVGEDEADRNRRQQNIFYLILNRLVQNGSLAKLPDLYQAFQRTVETNLELPALLDSIPLVLRLGDAQRFSFYQFGENELSRWTIPGDLASAVFLPKPQAVPLLWQEALNFIQTPAPLSEMVNTYAAALTRVPSATISRTPSMTPIHTPTRPPSLTPARTLTPSITSTRSNTFTITPTGPTPTATITPTGPMLTPTTTFTPTPSPSGTP